jgi:monofunctional biosynthetic peptidoglycan transglycosylase
MTIIRSFLTLILGFIAFSFCVVIFYRFVPVPYTPLMFWKSAGSLFSKERIGIEKKWVPLKEIAVSMQKSVIRAEDAKFYIHNGFDFEAIEAAIKYNKTHKKQKGASTISQQTAKNVFLWPSRSWLRKGMEAYFTVLIELLWSKQRILEVYLNVIELGPGVYGVEASAQKFFHKKARALSRQEAALMAAVLPNPIKFKINKPSTYILKRQRKIMGGPLVAITSVPGAQLKVDEAKEFFDIKFDDEDEKDNPALDNNSKADPEKPTDTLSSDNVNE